MVTSGIANVQMVAALWFGELITFIAPGGPAGPAGPPGPPGPAVK